MSYFWKGLIAGLVLYHLSRRTFGLAGDTSPTSQEPFGEEDLRRELAEPPGKIPESFFAAFRQAAALQRRGQLERDRIKLMQSKTIYLLLGKKLKANASELYRRFRNSIAFSANWVLLHRALNEDVPVFEP